MVILCWYLNYFNFNFIIYRHYFTVQYMHYLYILVVGIPNSIVPQIKPSYNA